MIDLPIGKALVAVLSDVHCNNECEDEDYRCTLDCCKGCELKRAEFEDKPDYSDMCNSLFCISAVRGDDNKVVFKLVDYPIQIAHL